MDEETILMRIKRGDPKAIASLMSRLLQPQGITVKANRKDNVLVVLLEASYVPDPERMVQFIQTGLRNLRISSVQTVKLYGKQTDHAAPAWNRELVLTPLQPPAHGSRQPEVLPNDQQVINDQKIIGDRQRAIASAPAVAPSTGTRVDTMLLVSLWLRIGFDALFILYSLVWATYYIYYFLDLADTTGFWTYLINQLVQTIGYFFIPLERIANGIYWATALFMLLWLHQFHTKLRRVFSDYPISPWGAVARFAIPFYNVWGIWNLFTTLARRLDIESAPSPTGKRLRRWLPIFYASFIASNGLRQVYWMHIDPTTDQTELAVWLYVLRNAVALLLSIAWLKLVWNAIRAIRFK